MYLAYYTRFTGLESPIISVYPNFIFPESTAVRNNLVSTQNRNESMQLFTGILQKKYIDVQYKDSSGWRLFSWDNL